MTENNPSQFIIYQSEDGQIKLDVRFVDETVWLTQALMAELFQTSSDNIGLHLKNIFTESELDENSTTKDFSVVRQEGSRQVKRSLKHYNLDAIISVGYRVQSRTATRFRQWATQTLKQYIIQGYTLNQYLLDETSTTDPTPSFPHPSSFPHRPSFLRRQESRSQTNHRRNPVRLMCLNSRHSHVWIAAWERLCKNPSPDMRYRRKTQPPKSPLIRGARGVRNDECWFVAQSLSPE